MYKHIIAAPESTLPESRRGAVVGRYCRACGAIYSRHAARHVGKPEYGRDHIASPCSYEGRPFVEGADWWEPAVELLQAAPADAA